MQREWEREKRRIKFWWGNLRKRDHLGDPGVDGKNNIKMALQEVGYAGID